ncbi:hypothetical protein PLG01_01900 [Streptococcus mutans PKUSS-LG01]|nr:hypothetical protein PLG01_01900 [Streptococcus mutans PKUSS-LG01]
MAGFYLKSSAALKQLDKKSNCLRALILVLHFLFEIKVF